MPSRLVFLKFQVSNSREVKGKLVKYAPVTIKRMQALAENLAVQGTVRIQQEILRTYVEPHPRRGALARSVNAEVNPSPRGLTLTFRAGTRVLPYITRAVSNSRYLAGPTLIEAMDAEWLSFIWAKRGGRRVRFLRVMHPGFGGRDAIRVGINRENRIFKQHMTETVRSAHIEVSTGASR